MVVVAFILVALIAGALKYWAPRFLFWLDDRKSQDGPR